MIKQIKVLEEKSPDLIEAKVNQFIRENKFNQYELDMKITQDKDEGTFFYTAILKQVLK
jgi:hypothetical protein